MTNAELDQLTRCYYQEKPTYKVAMFPDGRKIYRTYRYHANYMHMWNNPRLVLDEIIKRYSAVQSITMDANLGVLVTKIVLWDELFTPSDCMRRPVIREIITAEAVTPDIPFISTQEPFPCYKAES